jgi:tetratricopeptide (TPR) repeat protein
MNDKYFSTDVINQQVLSNIDYTAPGKLIYADLEISSILATETETSFWEDINYSAAEWWLTGYEPESDDNLEQVRGYLEAFYHLCEIEKWEKAAILLFIRLNTPTHAELHLQLGTWGYYSEQIEIYTKICDKFTPTQNSIFLKNLGVAYRFLDNFPKANEYYSQALTLFLELGQKEEGAWILHEMGLIEADRGNDEEARGYYEKALKVFEDLNVCKGIALVHNDIARVEVNQGNHQEAIERYRMSLNIYPDSEEKTGCAWISYNLGQALVGQEEYLEARNYINKSLNLFRDLENRTGITWCLLGLGGVMLNLGDEGSAYNLAREALSQFRELQNQTGMAWTLHLLGRIEFRRGNLTFVSEHYREKILIWKSINNLKGIAVALEGFARLLTIQQQNKQLLAPYVFGAAEAIREENKYPVPLSERAEYNSGVYEAKKQTDETEFLTAWNSGKVTPIEQVFPILYFFFD